MGSLSQIRAQVTNILRRSPEARVIGIRTVNGWTGTAQIRVNDREYNVIHCASELQIREALLEAGSAATPVVIVTNLEEGDLGQDVVVRFARRRLHPIDGWTILKDVFQAREIDPGLLRRPWLADMVMEILPTEGVPPVPAGVLDSETVWGLILRKSLGFESSRPDVQDLLRWSMDAANPTRLAALSTEMQKSIREWLVESAGKTAVAILDCVDAGLGAEAFPVGLALCAVFADPSYQDLQAAAARLERYTGGKPIRPDVAQTWADASRALFDRLQSMGADQQVLSLADRSDQILREIRADHFAWLSDYSRVGLELRLDQFGRELSAALASGSSQIPDAVLAAADAIGKHRLAERFQARANQVEMAVRLLRWLLTGSTTSTKEPLESFEEVAHSYAREGGFVDWARTTLFQGDPVETVAAAYNQLCEAVAQRREAQNKCFAHLLSSWMDAGCRVDTVVLVEDVLKAVVAPATQAAPVLLVVVDGMGFAVYRELIEDIRKNGWVELNRKGEPPRAAAIAALPSVTEVCRRSLLTGRLTSGTGDEEKQGFAIQPDLVQVSKPGAPPMLFQKSDLTEAGGASLAADLRREIASPKRRVVAAIVNAVDDHLLKGEQVAVPWTLRHVPVLNHLMAAAMDAGRLVILTSDHGHVLDRQTVYRPSTVGERYRVDDGHVGDDEVRIAGSRVVLPPGGRLIAPWSERVRYGGKRNGYHGGVSPQECLIPIAVLGWPSLAPSGYEAVPAYEPDWWGIGTLERRVPVTVPTAPAMTALPTKYSKRGQAELPLTPPTEPGTWIERLMESSVLARQLKQAGRSAPAVERLRQFLMVLDERGGTILRPALAQKLGEPELRVPGLIAAVRRILNVDGYPVLSVDDTSGSVVLNRQLLEVQFELGEGESRND